MSVNGFSWQFVCEGNYSHRAESLNLTAGCPKCGRSMVMLPLCEVRNCTNVVPLPHCRCGIHGGNHVPSYADGT
jgi:hypothetical protein